MHTNNSRAPGIKYRLDSPLTQKGLLESSELGKSLCATYPGVTKIISSPYLRTRQTACRIAQHFPCATIIIEADVSEYLGNQKSVDTKELSPVTLSYNPPLVDDLTSFKKRLNRFQSKLPRDGHVDTIVVTHGYCINIMNKTLNGRRSCQ